MKWFLLLTLMGCAQVASLNLKKHQFGILPTKIIWFQIAGLEEEQIAMLRFQYSSERRTAFEENTCIGQTWSYNLYDLKAKAETSFLTQITGKKNVRMNCSDAELKPLWSYVAVNGYNTGVLEIGASPAQSLLSLEKCGESGQAFLSPLYYWLRQEPSGKSETFHYSEKIPLHRGKVYYDRTCSKAGCLSSISDDSKAIYDQIKRSSHKHIFILRDFSYLAALEKKDFLKARQILADIEKAYSELLSYSKDSDYLILLTTAESKMLQYPEPGKSWFEFDKSGANAQVRGTKLTNLVLASGSRAENFCGLYEDADVFERILSGPKQQGLELKFINPFK